MEEKRLDIMLTNLIPDLSRQRAKALIEEGKVFVNGKIEDKPAKKVTQTDKIDVSDNTQKYVGRGGYKLEKAIEFFNIDLNGKVCIDIGASTGGFTDCMLQNGASKVYAVDVGFGQLSQKLCQDSRVISKEKMNVRYAGFEDFGEYVDFISVDVSFISLTKILSVTKSLLKENGELVCLIKPQFEAGKQNVRKNGIVKDKKVHEEVLFNVLNFIIEIDFNVLGLICSPIKGTDGNIEYLVHISKKRQGIAREHIKELAHRIAEQSHENKGSV